MRSFGCFAAKQFRFAVITHRVQHDHGPAKFEKNDRIDFSGVGTSAGFEVLDDLKYAMAYQLSCTSPNQQR